MENPPGSDAKVKDSGHIALTYLDLYSPSNLTIIPEETRLRELLGTEILDSPRNARFDDILEQLCETLGCSFARLSFVDKERIWIKSRKGTSITEFPRAGSIEDLLVRRGGNFLELKKNDLAAYQDPFNENNLEIEDVVCVAIRSESSAIIGCLILAFTLRRTYSDEFKNILFSAATKFTEIIENRKAADSLLATLRDQQEEIRIRYSSERIARTLTSAVNDRSHYHQVVESFTQTILNEFDWWACQIWFENDGQLIPEKWIFGPSAPRNIFNLEKIFSSPLVSPSNEEMLTSPYATLVSPILESPGILWSNENKRLGELGLRTFLDVNVSGSVTTAIRLLFVLPNSKVLPTRLKLTFENVVALLPQVLRRARSVEELNYRASHDELTGLLNRRGLDLEFAHLPEQAGGKRSRTVFFLDLDQFKLVNDFHGHQVGDELLVEVSHRLMKSSRPVDAIARIGGDEFVIVAQGFDEPEEIHKTSDRFLRNLGEAFTSSDGVLLEPRVSIGISTWDVQDSLSDAVAEADKNMYAAKGRGGHQAISDGWVPADNLGFNHGDEYSLTFQSISNPNLSEDIGVLVKVKLPAFIAPRLISDISKQLCAEADSFRFSNEQKPLLMLEVLGTNRSDRTNAVSLIDSVTEHIGARFSLATVVNLDSKGFDPSALAREIIEHGGTQIAFGNVFNRPIDLKLLEEIKPSFFLHSEIQAGWDNSSLPSLADRAALLVSADLGITTILPISSSVEFADYLSKFSNILHLHDEMRN